MLRSQNRAVPEKARTLRAALAPLVATEHKVFTQQPFASLQRAHAEDDKL